MNRLLLVAALGICLITSCSPQGGLKSRKVTLFVTSLEDPFYVSLVQGAQAAAVDLNLDLLVLGIERETYVERQIALVKNEIIKRVGVIIIAPADSKALVGVLKKAKEKGIAVLTIDTPLDQALMKQQGVAIPFVGPDHRAAGKRAGEYLVQRLGGKGEVAVLTGVAGVLSGDLCVQGFLGACTEAAGVSVAAQQSANWRRKDAAKAVGDILKKHPNLRGMFAVNRAMTLGALEGLKAGGKEKDVVVVGFGRDQEVEAALSAGRLAAALDMHPAALGRTAVELARKLLAGQSLPSETATPWDLVEAGTPPK
ncbi:MAG: sugar ABC transporter substrate-binding protein [Planctomycetes bacterium]|nr:sugar ABC transporter substrate-binding protein [Planctomycetota bacterium]